MGILPYNYNNYSYNSINDPNYDIKRQLSTRQAQLDKLNSYDTLSSDQQKQKLSLEKTIGTLSDRLDKKLKISQEGHKPSTQSAPDKPTSKPEGVTRKVFEEGTVIAKDNSYLKGFFFDTKI